MDRLANRKVYVGKYSKEIQEKAFELGFKWKNRQEFIYLDTPFLFFYPSGEITYSFNLQDFNNQKFEEVTSDYILNLKNKADFSIFDKDKVFFVVSKLGKEVEYKYLVKGDLPYNEVSMVSLFLHQKTYNRCCNKEEVITYRLANEAELKIWKKFYPEETLKPFDKVLVRDSNVENWKINLFNSYKEGRKYKFRVLDGVYKYCIPFKGNEHLHRTNKSK